MPAILNSLQRLLKLFENNSVPYMIIGGYALPFYGRIRTTVNIDLAVATRTQEEFNKLLNMLESADFEPTIRSPLNPLVLILDRIEKIEIELWLRPDGITLNNETLRKRRKVKLDENTTSWIVSPEDLIVNKLARPDRGATDEQDVKSILVRQEGKLDEEYLRKKAQKAGVLTILKTIQAL